MQVNPPLCEQRLSYPAKKLSKLLIPALNNMPLIWNVNFFSVTDTWKERLRTNIEVIERTEGLRTEMMDGRSCQFY